MAKIRAEKNLELEENKWDVFEEVDWDDLEEKNFEKVKVIGEGGFGKVCLVRQISTGKPFAMKAMRKHRLLDPEKLRQTELEKYILI